MQAIVISASGPPEVLRLGEIPDPTPAPDQVLIRVTAAGVNRADLLQRTGLYPPPPGASETLGMEVSGVVERTGADVFGWPRGTHVMALIEGGGYAELATAPARQVMHVPESVDLVAAGGVPEVFITAHDGLFTRGRLHPGEIVLVHGGAGGVGTAAIQLATRAGCRVIATAGGDAKLRRAHELGADVVINYRSEDFAARVREATDGRGADVILDIMGAANLQRNVETLATDGRLVVIGLQGGTQAELDIGLLLRRRASVAGTTLRGRPPDQKAAIVAAFTDDVLPLLAAGDVHPVIDRVLPLAEAAEAHRALEAGEITGKVVLRA